MCTSYLCEVDHDKLTYVQYVVSLTYSMNTYIIFTLAQKQFPP